MSTKTISAYCRQCDGHHYTDKRLQPLQIAYRVFNGDTCACKVMKYLTRLKNDWGLQIDKAEHVLEIYIEDIQYSPIRALTPLQEGLLTEFISQEPEEVRGALTNILMHMVNCQLAYVPHARHASMRDMLEHNFQIIRDFRCGETTDDN